MWSPPHIHILQTCALVPGSWAQRQIAWVRPYNVLFLSEFSNVESSWAELTQWLKSPLHVSVWELLDIHLHSHLPVRTKQNKTMSETAFWSQTSWSLDLAVNATIFYSDLLNKIYSLPRLEDISHHFKLPIRKAFYKILNKFCIIYLPYISKYQNL